jgi:hypothetical protein
MLLKLSYEEVQKCFAFQFQSQREDAEFVCEVTEEGMASASVVSSKYFLWQNYLFFDKHKTVDTRYPNY